ncbi:MAG: phosphatase PAP2 family protein, partial [Solirubrobacteraceae bacterium]
RNERIRPRRSIPRTPRDQPRPRLVLAVGAGRVYLGAHYPTDALAGWLLAALCISVGWAVAERSVRRRPEGRE